MRIVPVKVQNNISFKSLNRTVYKKSTGEYGAVNSDYAPPSTTICYRNYTYFFRRDLSPRGWSDFIYQIEGQFKDAKKVNVYDFACSDGSETYSLVISMIETLGKERSKKFFPIKASDIDEEVIKNARKYSCQCSESDLTSIYKNTNNKFEKYFYPIYDRKNRLIEGMYDLKNGYFNIKAKPILTKAIEFKRGDILDEIDNIEPSNSLIFCRNFWPYLDDETIKILIDKLKRIDSSSRVVTGKYDDWVLESCFTDFHKYFKPVNCKCPRVFQKRDKENKSV